MTSMTDPTDSTTAETTSTMPSWQTEPCPTWCTWTPHGEHEHPDDRHHTSQTYKRNLPLEVPVKVGPHDDWEPEYVAVYLWQHVREAGPAVRVAKGETTAGFTLTLEDAEGLAALLTAAVDEARRG